MSRYTDIIEAIFHSKYNAGMIRVPFSRIEFDRVAAELGFTRIKNLGDIVYSFRYRVTLPQSIQESAPLGYEWIILGTGIAEYEFRLANNGKVSVSPHRTEIKILDATPEILKQYAPGTDEQALLTKVRYNRLIDIFTSLTCYSIQNHYRTTVPIVGQVEVDEIYIGVSKNGAHYVLPCQAKSPGDSFGIAQVYQDIELCRYRYSSARCRPIGIQFTSDNSMVILELKVSEDNDVFSLSITEEKHYKLVPRGNVDFSDLRDYLIQDAM